MSKSYLVRAAMGTVGYSVPAMMVKLATQSGGRFSRYFVSDESSRYSCSMNHSPCAKILEFSSRRSAFTLSQVIRDTVELLTQRRQPARLRYKG